MGKRASRSIVWEKAPDIKKRIDVISKLMDLNCPKGSNIYCVRSNNANTRAYARIWGLSRIWQETLSIDPSYIIEVISEKFDDLQEKQQDKILLHELAHIPNNFSGSLIPHIRRGKRKFSGKVDGLISKYFKYLKEI
ncbi:MAG: putative metallopeptidase [bacterium]|nr:putative metallopeptidase [bacterium]